MTHRWLLDVITCFASSFTSSTDKNFTIKFVKNFAICQFVLCYLTRMSPKFSSLFLVIILVKIVVTRQSLKPETTFEDEQHETKSIERNRAAEERINLSFPGTKWCGPGNTADGYDDLGNDAETDKCCRQHDHCDNIPSGEEKHGLKNDDYFTRLHCECDKEFKSCLRNVNSKRGNYIGNFYFNVRDRCYKEQSPIVNCDEIHTKWAVFHVPWHSLPDTSEENFRWCNFSF